MDMNGNEQNAEINKAKENAAPLAPDHQQAGLVTSVFGVVETTTIRELLEYDREASKQ